ncbi:PLASMODESMATA CALLOSE-BINDING PROTEIN 4-like [Zootermopsis nevadensis]|uniref:Uncharacterized protein n=1 Tax=Zootermopsis nevadensis TaxID=136037 RepID=A0A067RJA5_ZOONE|nr:PLASMODESMATA CALLOSE-BINDING PROTEIN 4-like [Zootermopsis nevadensis]KDR19436.1 hypothetical protein L798_06210 [Zootermopsis nevadensis]
MAKLVIIALMAVLAATAASPQSIFDPLGIFQGVINILTGIKPVNQAPKTTAAPTTAPPKSSVPTTAAPTSTTPTTAAPTSTTPTTAAPTSATPTTAATIVSSTGAFIIADPTAAPISADPSTEAP